MLRCLTLLGCTAALLMASCDKQNADAPKSPDAASPASPQPAPSGGTAQARSPNPKWIAEETIHEFGTVWANEVITYPFRINNDGGQTLKILEVKPRCSCTVADGYSKEIEPGATGFIPFRLNTASKRGAVDEYLTIKTNDPVRPEMVLHMRGIVKAIVETEVVSDSMAEAADNPKEALNKIKSSGGQFGVIKIDQRLQRVIKIRNATEKLITLKFRDIQPPNSHFAASLQESEPNQEYLLTIIGDPPFTPGQNGANVTLETDIPGRPVYNIGIYAYVPGRIDVMPDRMIIDPSYPYVRERKIVITNYGDTPFEIIGLSTTEPAYQCSLERPSQPSDRQWVVKVTLPEQGYRPPSYGEIIRIETNDAEKKNIDISVLPYIDRPATVRPVDKPVQWHPAVIPPKK